MWEITIHYLHLHSVPLHGAVKSTTHSTPLHFGDTVAGIPGDALAGGDGGGVTNQISVRCLSLAATIAASSYSHEPWGLGL